MDSIAAPGLPAIAFALFACCCFILLAFACFCLLLLAAACFCLLLLAFACFWLARELIFDPSDRQLPEVFWPKQTMILRFLLTLQISHGRGADARTPRNLEPLF